MSPQAKEKAQGIAVILLIFFSPGIAEGLAWLLGLIPFSGPIMVILFAWGFLKFISFVLKEILK